MVHSIRLWHHLLLGWSTPSGSDATQSWDGLLHPAVTPLNPGMVYSIRLWRHSILGWFTLSGSDATQSWDGLLYPALTPLNPGMVYSIRLWRHSILGWLTLSGSETTQSWEGLLHPALTPLNPGMIYSIRLSRHLPGMIYSIHLWRHLQMYSWDRWPHPVWHHSPDMIDPIRLRTSSRYMSLFYNNYLSPPSNHQHFQWCSHVATLDCMVYPSQFDILFRHALFNIPVLPHCYTPVFVLCSLLFFRAEAPSLHQAWFTNTSLLQSSPLSGCGPLQYRHSTESVHNFGLVTLPYVFTCVYAL